MDTMYEQLMNAMIPMYTEIIRVDLHTGEMIQQKESEKTGFGEKIPGNWENFLTGMMDLIMPEDQAKITSGLQLQSLNQKRAGEEENISFRSTLFSSPDTYIWYKVRVRITEENKNRFAYLFLINVTKDEKDYQQMRIKKEYDEQTLLLNEGKLKE